MTLVKVPDLMIPTSKTQEMCRNMITPFVSRRVMFKSKVLNQTIAREDKNSRDHLSRQLLKRILKTLDPKNNEFHELKYKTLQILL